MTRDFLAGRIGVDAIALVSMSAALLLGETLAGVVVAVMYAGGNVLEDFAVARAERDLKSLVDRAPRVAHRRSERGVEDIAVEQVAVGDAILVRAGEIIPIDGVIASAGAVIDESALTGEPIPVSRGNGEPALERHAQCRRDVRDPRHRDGRREHLCGHRADGDGGADRQGAVHPAGGPLRAAAAAGHPRRRRGGVAVVGRFRFAGSRCWSRRRRAR